MTLCYFTVAPIIAFVAWLTYRCSTGHKDDWGDEGHYWETFGLGVGLVFAVELLGAVFILLFGSFFQTYPVVYESTPVASYSSSGEFTVARIKRPEEKERFVIRAENGAMWELSPNTEIMYEDITPEQSRFDRIRNQTDSWFMTMMMNDQYWDMSFPRGKDKHLVVPRDTVFQNIVEDIRYLPVA